MYETLTTSDLNGSRMNSSSILSSCVRAFPSKQVPQGLRWYNNHPQRAKDCKVDYTCIDLSCTEVDYTCSTSDILTIVCRTFHKTC